MTNLKKTLLVAVTISIAILAGYFAWRILESGNNITSSSKVTSKDSQEKPEENPLVCIQSLPNDMKLAQKLMFAGYPNTLADLPIGSGQSQIGGVILMNEVSGASAAELKRRFSINPLVATDQEGGSVARFQSFGNLPGAQEMALSHSHQDAYKIYLENFRKLKDVGVSVNFAPVIDVLTPPHNPLPGRMYSTDPAVVVAYAEQLIRASQAAGIHPVVKHFPGLGSASGNTDFEVATTDPIDILKTRDIPPYKDLSKYHPDAMVSNAVTPGLTNSQPAIWSKQAVDLLRGLGYKDAILYSDSLTAEAVPGPLSEAVVKSWQAGIDVAVIVQSEEDSQSIGDYMSEIFSIAKNLLSNGDLSQDDINSSMLRIMNRKNINPCSLPEASKLPN